MAPVADAVVPLIEVDASTHTYRACESTLEWIASHPRPFGVIACAGKYRTGKSFLLNMLTESSPGFGVGETVQACTKGLWVRRQFFRVHDDLDVLFVDTEGIDALDASDDGDVRIFTLGLLLSSCFVYNSVGPIDEAAIGTLGLMTRVTEAIRASVDDGSETISDEMPSFTWVLRDFGLRMVDRDGRELTANEYLEHALEAHPSATDTARGATRASIVECFPSRRLVTMPRPTKSDSDAQNINGKPWLINAKFHEAVSSLRESLYASLTPVRSGSVALTGSMYASLCRHLASHGGTHLPVRRDTWSLMASVHARDLRDAVLADARDEVASWSPNSRSSLEAAGAALRAAALGRFDDQSLKPSDAEQRALLATELDAAVAARIAAVGRDMDELVQTAVSALDVVADDAPGSLLAALDSSRRGLVESYGAAEVDGSWSRIAGGRALQRWMPRIVRHSEREAAAAAAHASEATSRALREAQAEASEVKDELRDAQCRIQELEASVETQGASIEAERAALAECRGEMAELRVNNSELAAALTASDARFEEAADAGAAKAAAPELEAAREALAEASEARVRLEAAAATKDDELRACRTEKDDLVRRLDAAAERERRLTESWTKGLDTLRAEADATRSKLEADAALLQSKLDASELEQQALRDKLSDSEMETARLEQERERDTRQSAAVLERTRESCQQAQDRVIEMHKSMLDDLRQRDDRVREMQSKFADDLSSAQSRYTETVRQVESRDRDVRDLKRRVGELEGTETEVKRLRADSRAAEAQRHHDERERAQLATRVDVLTQESETLRRRNLELENELAVLRAERQLEQARAHVSRAASDEEQA